MRSTIETVMGAVVLLIAGMFVYVAYTTAQISTEDGYEVTATFFKVGGLTAGSDVRINGIKVGTVSGLNLDRQTYDAVVHLSIAGNIQLPTDTVAAIGSEGILGGKYVRIDPGSAGETIAAGGQIERTQDFRSLEDQVGEIIFLATGGEDGSGY